VFLNDGLRRLYPDRLADGGQVTNLENILQRPDSGSVRSDSEASRGTTLTALALH
jgi:hypothetical protein